MSKDYVLTKRCTSPSTTSVTAAVEDKAIRSVVSGPRVVATGPPVRASPGGLDETARLPICARAFARCCFLRDILQQGYFQAGSSVRQRAYSSQSVYCASMLRALFQGYTCQLLSYLLAALARPSPGTTRGLLGAHLSNIEEREKHSGHGEYLKKPDG